jgi:2-iminoacetate synthase ThiH
MMEINVSQDQGRVSVTVLKIIGNLTSESELAAQADKAHDAGSHHILLDLSEVPYVSSSGLRALHYIFTLLKTAEDNKTAEKEGIVSGSYVSSHLKLLKPNKHVLEVLKTAGYDMFLEIHTDYQKAIASF